MPTALITGVTGQDGSYLAEHLLDLGYRVVGVTRRTSTDTASRIEHLRNRIELGSADLLDQTSLLTLVSRYQPDEVYNLAAQSFVPTSWNQPVLTGEFTGLGVTRILEAIRQADPAIRFYQASSSEMFGKAQAIPQIETTPFWPRSPYAVAKVFSYWATINYRESYGLHASNGILFNHESPRRGETFVTRKITRAVAAIKYGLQHELFLGNLEAKRDWGYAPEFVEGMWRIVQQDTPDDFVLATNETHTVREFVQAAFAHADLDWQEFVKHDQRYERPAEVELLIGNPAKAKKVLEWEPKVRFKELVEIMVDADLEALSKSTAREHLGRMP